MRDDGRPNIVLIMADDLGFSDLGCYGSSINTPHLDALAAGGIQMTQFYNTARCSPARASLLTGLHPHQTGIGVLTNDDGPLGYPGTINDRCLTIAEVLSRSGYSTAIRGKWHLTGRVTEPNDAWPTRRGFDSFYGTLAGAGSYYDPVTLTRDEAITYTGDDFYLTTELGVEAAGYIAQHSAEARHQPFFLYLPFTAPHWPLHAPEDACERYRGAFDEGWDVLRRRQHQRLVDRGIVDAAWLLAPRDPDTVAWDDVADRDWQARRMEVYAAQVELMDTAIGEVVNALREANELDNTLIMFLSDNGGCAEELSPAWADELKDRPYNTPIRTKDGNRVRRGNDTSVFPGGPETFASYGKPWAQVSNTPFREYKHWVHEGGIATPFIAHWPAGDLRPGLNRDPHQLTDVMSTVLDITGATFPTGRVTTPQGADRDVLPLEGTSMLGSWRGIPAPARPLFFEHEGNCAIRYGQWKLVRKYGQEWELYNMTTDRTELTDVAAMNPDITAELATCWKQWAQRCGVKPRRDVIAATQTNTERSAYISSHRELAPEPST